MLKKLIFALALLGFAANVSYAQKHGGGSTGGSTDKKTTNTDKKTSDKNSPEDDVLETLGLMGGISLYNTYLLIGSIADNYASKGYTGEKAKELLEKQLIVIDVQINQLDKVSKSWVKKTVDKEAITKINDIFAGLKTQTQHAIDFIDTDDSTAAEQYEEQRTSNWEQISEFLGME